MVTLGSRMPFERRITSLALVACASLVLCGAVSASGQRASRITQAQFLGLAQSGIQSAARELLEREARLVRRRVLARRRTRRMPLAYLWSAFPLFEAIDAVAIAEPTAANKAAVVRFATGAERYWNGGARAAGRLRLLPGRPRPARAHLLRRQRLVGDRVPRRVPRDRRPRLPDREAARAFDFIVESGLESRLGRHLVGQRGTGTSPPSRSPPRPTSGPSSTEQTRQSARTCSR